MLAGSHIFPQQPPAGYEYLAEEPPFVPESHLRLEVPHGSLTLSDLGYSDAFKANYGSPLAVTEPFRVLSDEGLTAIRGIIDQLEPYVRRNPEGKGVPSKMRGTAYRSQFIRDFCLSEELVGFLSSVGGMDLVPTSYPHELAQLNFPPVDSSKPIVGWHHDKNAFVLVLMLHDPAEVEGGDLQYFDGTRYEGYDLLATGEDIPSERQVVPQFPGAGYGVLMQGSTLLHRATPLQAPGDRISMVTSYDTRDVSYPDPNRMYFVTGGFGASDPNSSLERRYRYVEYARHMAWRSSGKLANFIDNVPWTDDREQIVDELRKAVADAQAAIEMLERGDITREEAKVLRAEEDSRLPR